MAVSNSALMTTEEVRSITIHLIADSWDVSMLTVYQIEMAQLKHIKPVLTEKLYSYLVRNSSETICTNLLDGNVTYTYGDDTYYFEGLKKALAWFVMYEAIPHIHIKNANQGMRVNIHEKSRPATVEEMQMIRQQCWDYAQEYSRQVTHFLTGHDDYEDYYIGLDINNEKIIHGGILFDADEGICSSNYDGPECWR